jgi:hypothetical protein
MENRFSNELDAAVQLRQDEVRTCTNARLAELLGLAVAIDCYYAMHSDFLSNCATEAARRLAVE